MLSELAGGFLTAIGWQALILVVAGALWGIVGGALPGISTSAAVALALPLTFGMDPALALIFLGAAYTGGAYGGSITATLLNTPGTPEAAIMTFDGYAMTKNGEAGKALWAAVISGLIGGLLGTFILIVASEPLARQALRFGPPEYTSLAILGLAALAMLTGASVLKSTIAVILGIMIALIGLDPIDGVPRVTFDTFILMDGVPLIAALIGLFAVSEAFDLISRRDSTVEDSPDAGSFWSNRLTWAEFRRQSKFSLLGTGIGTFIGALPGGGATIASIIAYTTGKQVSSKGDNFGKGQMEGLSTPEAADKASVGGALIPTLTLGLPGSATTAVLIGALTLNNLQPGPNLFSEQADLVYALFASLILANIAVFFIGIGGLQFVIRVTTMSKPVLGIIILMLTMLGSYASETNIYGMWYALAFGAIGYVMKKYDFPTAPLILCLILTPLLEVNLRRSLLLSRGDYSIFVDRPIALVIIIASVLFALVPIYLNILKRRQSSQPE